MTVEPADAAHVQHLAGLVTEVGRRTRRFADRSDASTTMTRIAVDLVPGADFAGMTVFTPPNTFRTAGATDPLVERVDQIQYELRVGPCVDAVVADRPHISNDLAHDSQWPDFGRRAAGLGIAAMASYRLHLADARHTAGQVHPDDVVAGINLYSREPGAFDVDVITPLVTALATYAALAVWGGSLREEIDQLNRALGGSRDIGIAQGILLERFKVTRDQAFGLLAMSSQNSNRKLRDIAVELADTGQLPLPAPGRPRR